MGADYVILTVAEGDPTDLFAARQAVSDAVFESLMPRYRALPRKTGIGCVTNQVHWNVVTYDAAGHSPRSVCAASGCDFHDSPFIPGYFTAVLRSACTSAPLSPPPLGQTVVGPDYVIQTVGRGEALDIPAAQQMATDEVFESLMAQYCALPRDKGIGCVSDRVQWNILTYDGAGQWRVSASPRSGPGYHYCSGTNGIPGGEFITLRRGGWTLTQGIFVTSFPSTPGRQYVLECTDVLDRPAWKRINTAAGTGEILLLRDAADVGTSRFYRVRIE